MDAIGHLEVYEKLKEMPDLTIRLKRGESSLATRAATGVVADLETCTSPQGILPERYQVGKTTVTIELETIHSPLFKVPKYKVKDTNEPATLADIGLSCIVVPLSMLRLHIPRPIIYVPHQQKRHLRITPVKE